MVKVRIQILIDHNGGKRLDYITPDEWLDVPDGMSETRAALHALERAIERINHGQVDPHDPARRHD